MAKKGSSPIKRKTKGKKRHDLLIVALLLVLIGVMLYFSMSERPTPPKPLPYPSIVDTAKSPVETQPTPSKKRDSTKIKPSKKPLTTDTVAAKKPTEVTAKKTKPAVVIHPLLLVVPEIKTKEHIINNEQGRYVLSYDPQHKQAQWVAYLLSREDVSTKEVDRESKFNKDQEVVKRGWVSANDNDYKRSGYDRGHLMPSADRDNSTKENKSTFLYSNVAPQKPRLNRGAWKNLETQVRRWAMMYDSLCVVTAGVLTDKKPLKTIGPNKISVPNTFYKVLIARYNGQYYTIGFLLPNDDSVNDDFRRYTVSVDSVERVTGINFFHRLPDSIETVVEAGVDKRFWY